MRTSFHHQPEAQHPNFPLSLSWQADYPIFWHEGDVRRVQNYVRFSNRPFRVKRFQTIHDSGVNVARGLALLSGLGTKALVWGFLSQAGSRIFSIVGGSISPGPILTASSTMMQSG
jgi:hypothetical protein